MLSDQSREETIRVLVADNSRIHTQLLEDALKRDRSLEVISSPSDSHDLVEVSRLHHVDVVVISSNLDEEPLRGFEVLRELRAFCPQMRAVMLLDSSKREAILEAFRAGARGIFSRSESAGTLSKCVRSVHQGQIWASSREMGFAVEALASAPAVRAVNANGFNLLSKREMEVVRCLAEGLTNREIAERLGLSQHTIKNYLFRVFDKMGVSSRIELLFMTLSQANQHSTHGPDHGNGHAETAVAVYQQAAEQGLPGAQVRLAQMYREGRGVPQDMITAYMWYLLSEHTGLQLKAGVSAAKQDLADVLTTDQIEEAQQRATAHLKRAIKSSWWEAPRDSSNTARMLVTAASFVAASLLSVF